MHDAASHYAAALKSSRNLWKSTIPHSNTSHWITLLQRHSALKYISLLVTGFKPLRKIADHVPWGTSATAQPTAGLARSCEWRAGLVRVQSSAAVGQWSPAGVALIWGIQQRGARPHPAIRVSLNTANKTRYSRLKGADGFLLLSRSLKVALHQYQSPPTAAAAAAERRLSPRTLVRSAGCCQRGGNLPTARANVWTAEISWWSPQTRTLQRRRHDIRSHTLTLTSWVFGPHKHKPQYRRATIYLIIESACIAVDCWHSTWLHKLENIKNKEHLFSLLFFFKVFEVNIFYFKVSFQVGFIIVVV